MIRQFIRHRNKKTLFICQITDNSLKVIKCLINNNFEKEFVALNSESISIEIDEKLLIEKIGNVFKELGFNNNPVIVSLPRNNATCRYIKIPAQSSQEIEKIVSLQASRYLPYQANELITAYQGILSDKEGYSHINLVIVHRDIIQRYIEIFNKLRVKSFSIVLNSYGLCNLYNYVKQPNKPESVMLIDIDYNNIELAIIRGKKLVFSRYFKLDRQSPTWENLLLDEINKTQDTYLKETSLETPGEIIVFGQSKAAEEFAQAINKRASLLAETVPYESNVKATEGVLNRILNSDFSFAGPIGLGVEDLEESLNILPQEIKDKTRKVFQYKERLRIILFISAIFLFWFLAIAKNLDNKTKYLKLLKTELNKIAKEAQPIEEIEKRIKILEAQKVKSTMILDILYELHNILPNQISLTNLNYEEDNQIILRGQTEELNSVFAFIPQIKNSAAFKKFSPKVRYATKRKTQFGEIVDFEIICSKK